MSWEDDLFEPGAIDSAEEFIALLRSLRGVQLMSDDIGQLARPEHQDLTESDICQREHAPLRKERC